MGANVSEQSPASIFKTDPEDTGTFIFSAVRTLDFILMVYKGTSDVLKFLFICSEDSGMHYFRECGVSRISTQGLMMMCEPSNIHTDDEKCRLLSSDSSVAEDSSVLEYFAIL